MKIAAGGKSLDPAGVTWIMNPYDEFAVEQALLVKEKAGAGEVIVISLGGANVPATLRNALAMGADRGIHLKTDAAQVGPMVAELLDLPCVTSIATFALEGEQVKVEREIEGGREVVQASLPVVLTTDKGLNQPRFASLKGIMAAKKKPIEEKAVTAGDAALEVVALELPPARKAGRMVGSVDELVRALREEAQVL